MDFILEDVNHIDAGAYLTHPMFQGIYDGVKVHDADLDSVLKRAWKFRMYRMLIPGIDLESSRRAVEIAKTDDRLFCTVGVHPHRVSEFERRGEVEYYNDLVDLALANEEKVVAIGETGLDFSKKVHGCDKKAQYKCFEKHIELAHEMRLPLLMRCQNASKTMFKMLKEYYGRLRGFMTSFSGSPKLAVKLVNYGFHLGICGCSLKYEETLEAIKAVPPSRLVVTSHSPNCKIKKSYAGYKYIKNHVRGAKPKEKWSADSAVKGRTEPTYISQITDVISKVKDFDRDMMQLMVRYNAGKLIFEEGIL